MSNEAAEKLFAEEVHRLSPAETWERLPEVAKEVFRLEARERALAARSTDSIEDRTP